jgi:hypothetical protein
MTGVFTRLSLRMTTQSNVILSKAKNPSFCDFRF